MAVTLLKHYERFAGLSTDVKPANAPMGSTFFEWDTSKLYTLSPAGWVEKKGTIHGDVQLSGSNVEQTPGSAIPTKALLMGASDGTNIQTMLVDTLKNLMVSLGTALDKDIDSIDVGKMSKGGVTTAHSAITATATSEEIDCRGYNAVLVEVTISAAFNWTFKVQGCMVSGGPFVDCYEQANTGVQTLMSCQCNASRIFLFRGIPDYIKIVATEDEDGATVTVKVQPLNL